MRAFALFALASAALIALAGWALGRIFVAPDEPRAIWTAAAIAFVVQLVGFAIARRAARGGNAIAGWGIGILLRVVALAIVALVVGPALALPSSAVLIALVTFFFLSTLVEPLFLSSSP